MPAYYSIPSPWNEEADNSWHVTYLLAIKLANTMKISETWILNYFMNIHTHEYYQPYSRSISLHPHVLALEHQYSQNCILPPLKWPHIQLQICHLKMVPLYLQIPQKTKLTWYITVNLLPKCNPSLSLYVRLWKIKQKQISTSSKTIL